LKIHETTHPELQDQLSSQTDSKDFPCDKCSKTFLSDAYLKKHKRNSHAEKNFLCDLCSKTFRSGSELKTHQLSHTGFPCLKCDKVFTRSYRSLWC
jgi:uncharacterized Zn-finger protein